MKATTEVMNGDFSKYHLTLNEQYLCGLHHFTGADLGFPHDHPWDFTTYILLGGYVEDIYTIHADRTWSVERVERLPGTVHSVKASQIHKIVSLPAGECWTVVRTGPPTRQTRFWHFGTSIKSIAWNEEDCDSNWKLESTIKEEATC